MTSTNEPCTREIGCPGTPKQHIEAERNGRHFADDIFNRIFLNENIWIPIKISLKFVPKGPINNIPAMVQIMAWRRPGDKPLSGPMVVSLLTHICIARPQWVKWPGVWWAKIILYKLCMPLPPNISVLNQEKPQLQGFGTQWSVWCTQAWNMCIAIMNQVAFPASELLQHSRHPQNEAQNWIMGSVANGLLKNCTTMVCP